MTIIIKEASLPIPEIFLPVVCRHRGQEDSNACRGYNDKEGYTSVRKWSKDNIGAEIRRLYETGENLNYASIAKEHVALLRAATRYFGSWRLAVEFAGLNYEDIRRYKTWNRERILERIRELYTQGEDLSWRHVSTQVDPQLAAAATKRKHFGSWRGAVTAAGLDYSQIRRYREWDEETIKNQVRELHEKGIDLNAKNMEEYDITLITAARRRFDSWDRALTAAGLDYRKIVLRSPFKRRRRALTPPSDTFRPHHEGGMPLPRFAEELAEV